MARGESTDRSISVNPNNTRESIKASQNERASGRATSRRENTYIQSGDVDSNGSAEGYAYEDLEQYRSTVKDGYSNATYEEEWKAFTRKDPSIKDWSKGNLRYPELMDDIGQA